MRTQQNRTFKIMNMHLIDQTDCDNAGWPIVQPTKAIMDKLAMFCMGAKGKEWFARNGLGTHGWMRAIRYQSDNKERLRKVDQRTKRLGKNFSEGS